MYDGLTCLSADSNQKVSLYNISHLLYRGQLREYKYDRVLSTLDKNFSSFNNSLCEFVFKKAKDEAGSLEQQPLLSSITKEDIDTFEYATYYAELSQSAPVLHAAVTGAMASHFSYGEVRHVIEE